MLSQEKTLRQPCCLTESGVLSGLNAWFPPKSPINDSAKSDNILFKSKEEVFEIFVSKSLVLLLYLNSTLSHFFFIFCGNSYDSGDSG